MTTERRPDINLRTIAPLVAKAMGPAWKAKLDSEGETHHADLFGPDGARITMNADNHGQRISMGGYIDYKDSQNFLSYKETTPKATVSPTKSPEAIAKDITRRILPDYLPMLAKVQTAKAKSDAAVTAKRATAERIAEAIGGKVDMWNAVDHRWNPVEVSAYRSRLFPDGAGNAPTIKVHAEDSVSLDISVSAAEALAILAAIDTFRNAK